MPLCRVLLAACCLLVAVLPLLAADATVSPSRYASLRWRMIGPFRGRQSQEQPLTVKMDPRVQTSIEELTQQFELSLQCYEGARQAHEALDQVRQLRAQVKKVQDKISDKELKDALADLDQRAAALEGSERRRGARPPSDVQEPSLARVGGDLQGLQAVLQGADAAPTTQAVTACDATHKLLGDLLGRWNALKDKDVKALNDKLRKANLPPLMP